MIIPPFLLPFDMDFLHHPETDRIIRDALREDIGEGDHTTLSTVPSGHKARARCIIKDEGVLAGIDLAERIFELVDPGLTMERFKQDGDTAVFGEEAFHVTGDPRSILQAERLVLNFMQRMSGIATVSRKVSSAIKDLPCEVLDTRKTTPLIRHMEKWAVQIGGATNHRFGLYDMVMIKDNHIDYAGGITAAVNACKAYLSQNGLEIRIEVETRNLEEVREALAVGGVDVIMLDNMSHNMMREAVHIIDGKAKTEASGGVLPENVRDIALTGVDFISMGYLTHSAPSLDISLKAIRES